MVLPSRSSHGDGVSRTQTDNNIMVHILWLRYEENVAGTYRREQLTLPEGSQEWHHRGYDAKCMSGTSQLNKERQKKGHSKQRASAIKGI